MRNEIDRIIEVVAAWDDVNQQPHRFGGIEFNLGKIEIGHVHLGGGLVDIPFTRRIREALVKTGAAEHHHLLPETGWISFWLGRTGSADDAIRLYRLSYLHKRARRDRTIDLSGELTALWWDEGVIAAATNGPGSETQVGDTEDAHN